MEILFWALSTVGMTAIITDSRLLATLRELIQKLLPNKVYELVSCSQCAGFWVGMFTAKLMFDPTTLAGYLLYACIGSYLSMVSATLLNRLS